MVDNSKVKGVRDWLPGTEFEQHWVPCASVLHPCIENNMSHVATKDFLVIDHWKRKPITLDIHHTRLVNNPCTIEQIVSTIADHNYVLTSSYHVAYWATLLKKKVIVISDPWQFKFDHFRHPPVLAEKFSWGLLDRARSYPEAYKQCLSANKQMLKTLRELPTQDIVVFDSIDDPSSPTDQSV